MALLAAVASAAVRPVAPVARAAPAVMPAAAAAAAPAAAFAPSAAPSSLESVGESLQALRAVDAGDLSAQSGGAQAVADAMTGERSIEASGAAEPVVVPEGARPALTLGKPTLPPEKPAPAVAKAPGLRLGEISAKGWTGLGLHAAGWGMYFAMIPFLALLPWFAILGIYVASYALMGVSFKLASAEIAAASAWAYDRLPPRAQRAVDIGLEWKARAVEAVKSRLPSWRRG